MKKLGLFALVVAASSLFVANAHAVDLNGKKGIGYTDTLNGVNGFNFQFGTGNLIIEGILGLTHLSPKDNDAAGRDLTLGIGGHFQALRAEAAAWTIGGRINIGNHVDPDLGQKPEAITEFGLAIPTRVYWFPNKHISLHVETGIDIQLVGDKGTVYTDMGGEGTYFLVFDTSSSVGMTFWW
ncbi:MAG: hypothetical protein R3F60_01230 [bacterium]